MPAVTDASGAQLPPPRLTGYYLDRQANNSYRLYETHIATFCQVRIREQEESVVVTSLHGE